MTHKEKEKKAADRVVKFFAGLKHTKGIWAGVPFTLEPWQEKIIRAIFGRLNKNGTRQVRTVYVEIPRKNGKSELAAGIALYLLFADGEPGAEIYSCAGDRDQAEIVFNVAADMVRQNDFLSSRCDIIDSRKRIVIRDKGSFYRVISAESKTKHGFNASGIIFDELHVQPNRDLWDVMETSKGAREQPLTFAITTAGFDKHSICYEQHDYTQKIIKGTVKDKTFYGAIFGADKNDDWKDKKVWHKANPALKTFRKIDEMESLFNKAVETPALENTFRRLYLDQWTTQETRWLNLDKWDLCNFGPIKRERLQGRKCYAGLDLASTTDIAALALVFPSLDKNELYEILMKFWIPAESMHERSKKDRVPYDVWTRSGLITATPGNVIDYGAILQEIKAATIEFDFQELAFDRWGSQKLIVDMEDIGFNSDPNAKYGRKLIQFGQGFASMSPPTKELLNLVLQKKIRHGGNPVLRWMCDNMVVKEDPAGNLKPDKAKSTEKIDGMVALIMGLDRATKNKAQDSIYATRGVIAI